MKRKLNSLFVALLLMFGNYSTNADDNDLTVEKWMENWMSIYKKSGGVLHLSRFSDPTYIVEQEITWEPDNDDSTLKPVTVPVGFVTDLASIPPIFFSTLRPDGKYTHPAIIHDYQYWMQDVTKEEADEIFRLGMKEFDTGTIKTFAIYQAVDKLGWIAWNNNAKRKEQGEKRILTKFPEDPKITWEEWRDDPDVFTN